MSRASPRLVVPLILCALSACTHIGGAPIGELAELMTMGRSRQLQEPLRPIRGNTRVLVFALDGVGRDALYDALREGRMPNLAGALGTPRGDGRYEHAYAAPDMVSIFPSTTMPAWAAVFTGAPPAVNGIPGNEWLDRFEGAFQAPVPISVTSQSHAMKLFTDEFVSERLRAPTLYEMLPPLRMHVSMSPYYRGADLVTFPDLARFGDLVGATVGEAIAGEVKESARVAREMDQTSTASLIHVIGDVGLPDVQTVYLNGTDLIAHYGENPEADLQRYLEAVTDSAIGSVLDVYRESGALADTWVVVISDHGHTPVLPDDRHVLGMEGTGEPAEVLRRAGFRVRSWELSGDGGDFQAGFAYQGFTAYVYLADRSSCAAEGERCDWNRPPRLREDVLAAARAFHEASRTGAGVPEMRGTLDLILARDPAQPDRYLVFDGEGLVPVGEYLRRNPRPDLLRFEERLAGLTSGPHARLAGDLLLLAKSGAQRPIEDRYYFGVPETSEHGSASEQDSRIPLIVAHPGLGAESIERTVREAIGERPSQLDFAPLVRRLVTDAD
ncbi:MAG TPA: alkaline phosphatase family protein [Longimicrobiaceae bacterium]